MKFAFPATLLLGLAVALPTATIAQHVDLPDVKHGRDRHHDRDRSDHHARDRRHDRPVVHIERREHHHDARRSDHHHDASRGHRRDQAKPALLQPAVINAVPKT